jgi:hypothetical protein
VTIVAKHSALVVVKVTHRVRLSMLDVAFTRHDVIAEIVTANS